MEERTMKRMLAIALALVLILSLTACTATTGNGISNDDEENPASTPAYMPGGQRGGQGEGDQPADDGGDGQPDERSSPYHDSIWVLEGSGSTTITLEEGYFATYSVDMSLVKLEGGSAQGTYQGGMYITTDIDADEFIKDLLKDVPADFGAFLNFDVHAYALDNLTQLSLWNYYQYPGADWTKAPTDASGKEVSIAKDSFLGEGDIVMNFEVEGIAEGGTAETYLGVPGMNATDEGMVGYKIYCPPDGEETGDQNGGVRRAVITLTMRGETNVIVTIEGTLTRLPGGLENQDKFTRDRPPFSEKHGKGDTSLSSNLRP